MGLAGVEGLEPPTPGFGDRCSSQLSYTPSRADRCMKARPNARATFLGHLVGDRRCHHGGPISQHFSNAGRYLVRVIAHRQDGIGAHLLGMLDH